MMWGKKTNWGVRRSWRIQQRRRTCKSIPVVIFVVFMLMSVRLCVRMSVVSRSYDLEALRAQALQADIELRELKLVFAVKTRPSEMVFGSNVKLGMTPLSPENVRRITVRAG